MLCSLVIENLAIVTRLELDFSNGMTAFTGETGAGKSIMIDALMLAMGGRADASIIRAGESKCTVSACFSFEIGSEPDTWLRTHAFDTSSHEVWLRRVISLEGRSKAFINGEPMPLQKVKAFSELLLDIHGQHQHQRLLKPSTHRIQLDQFASHSKLLNEVNQSYLAYVSIQQEKALADAKIADDAHAEFLRYQINELLSLELQANEIDTLNQEHQCLHHAKSYLETLSTIQSLLKDGLNSEDIQTQLHHVSQCLDALPDNNAHLASARELIQSAMIQCEEAALEVDSFSTQIQLDPERLNEIEERLSLLHDAARKYQTPADKLMEKLTMLEAEASALQGIESEQARLGEALQKAKEIYDQAALKLRESRNKHAKVLEGEITKALRQLGINQGLIQIRITPAESMSSHGVDHVEYHVSTNPGIPPHALTKVASGGELSRISLAIQVITAKRAQTPTLFFDEVDVGIGGETAARVGRLLRTLGARLQVFCVTHQPQVAAAAHHHLVVKKHSDKTHTFSEVKILTDAEKTNEIARMLGGLHITEETHQHAKALLLEQLA